MTDPPAAPRTDLAGIEELAVAAIEHVARDLVRPSLGGPLSEHRWTSHSQVYTIDDHRAGLELTRLFTRAFPGHGFIVEDCEPIAGDGVHEWYIDPIDGSANHLRGIPYVAVTAGLAIEGRPCVGVVHDVVRGTTLSARRGGGARLHTGSGTRPVAVSGVAELRDAIVIAHLSRRGPLVCVDGALQHMLWHTRKLRCMGSIALDLALLACGEADLLVVGRGTPQRMLDIVGGMVVLEEAGGMVCTAAGGPVDRHTRTLVAGPPRLCEQFVELMAGHDLEAWTADRASPPATAPGAGGGAD